MRHPWLATVRIPFVMVVVDVSAAFSLTMCEKMTLPESGILQKEIIVEEKPVSVLLKALMMYELPSAFSL